MVDKFILYLLFLHYIVMFSYDKQVHQNNKKKGVKSVGSDTFRHVATCKLWNMINMTPHYTVNEGTIHKEIRNHILYLIKLTLVDFWKATRECQKIKSFYTFIPYILYIYIIFFQKSDFIFSIGWLFCPSLSEEHFSHLGLGFFITTVLNKHSRNLVTNWSDNGLVESCTSLAGDSAVVKMYTVVMKIPNWILG